MTPLPVKTLNLSKAYQAKQRQGLFKATYKEVDALKDVSLKIKAGEIFGLLRSNAQRLKLR